MAISSFRELTVWQKSFELTVEIYKLVKKFPPAEQYGLVSQIQRSSVSIPSNIAEGQHRGSSKEYCRFLGIALGSSTELETQLLLAEKIYKLEVNKYVEELHEIQKMLSTIIRKLQ